MTKVLIVGAMGIGAAHAIALHNLGIRDFTFLDLDQNLDDVRERYAGFEPWVNEWGHIHDECDPGEDTVVAVFNEKDLVPIRIAIFDYVVIATPTATHLQWLHRIIPHIKQECYVVCEKPLVYNRTEWHAVESLLLQRQRTGDRALRLSLEWQYHPSMPNVQQALRLHPPELTTVYYVHPNFHSDDNAVRDLLPHLLSLIQSQYHAPFPKVSSVVHDRLGTWSVVLSDGLTLTMGFDPMAEDRGIVMEFRPRDPAGSWSQVNLEWVSNTPFTVGMFERMHAHYLMGDGKTISSSAPMMRAFWTAMEMQQKMVNRV